MKTLEEVFRDNLKRLRGQRTQAEIAEAAGIPLRSYQHAESGVIPQGPNRTAIARALGTTRETELFMDQDLRGVPITPKEALEVIARELETRRETPARDTLAERIAKLTPDARQAVLDLVVGLEDSAAPANASQGLAEKDE